MATVKEQEALIQTLKFTPRTYTVNVYGYGGEVYAGRVDRKVYEYFKQRKIDLDEFAGDWDNELEVPQEFQPFSPGSAYDCDDLIHASGATMDDGSMIEVSDENGTTVWSSTMDLASLKAAGVDIQLDSEFYFDDMDPEQVAFQGAQGEKGTFLGGEIFLTAPFDPAKLSVSYNNADGWFLSSEVTYDGEYIDNDDYSTTGKWGENKWVLPEGEEAYDPNEDVEEGEENGGAGWPATYYPESGEEVEFKFKKHKPVHTGWYEANWGYGSTFGKLYWDGENFVDFAFNKPQQIDQQGIVSWSGLNWDTTNWDNCPQNK